MDTVRIPYPDLRNALRGALETEGVPPAIAQAEAEIMAEADLLGVPSHGVRMLPGLLDALRTDRAKPNPSIRVVRETTATCVLDADRGPARHLSLMAMRHATTRASECGVGVCLAIHTTHWGRAHAYAARAAQEGFVGICTTNAIPTMAGWGATHPVIGNNPLAIGIPGPDPRAPIVLDMAMSQAAVGKVGTWLREKRELPAGWGLDAQGRPSNDPAAILGGAVLPIGGHKGAALALMIELLTAALGNTAFGHEIAAADRNGLDPDSSKLFIAVNVAAIIEPEHFRARVAELLSHLSQEAGEKSPFLWPGQRGWEEKEQNLQQGVPIHSEILAQLRDAGLILV